MKKIVSIILAAVLALSLMVSASASDYSSFGFIKKIPMKPAYSAECEHKGTVEVLTYTCHSYAEEAANPGTEKIVEKSMYVYLPYGYNASREYNVLYLLHGGGEDERYWLGADRMGNPTCAVLDNMNEKGTCEPTIIVAPTINLGREPGTEPVYGDDVPKSNIDTLPTFSMELMNDIIPLIETKYSTFANGDVSLENLQATRDHRAFAGFSMGSMTTVQVMQRCLDAFAYFGNFSGAFAKNKENSDAFFAAMADDKNKDLPIKFWYHGNGTNDIALDDQLDFCANILEKMSDRVVDGENYAYIEFKGGTHAYNCWLPDLYNCLCVFFKQ